jgi:NAD-dependent deacetylase
MENLNPINYKRIVILTGAGISAESGIQTFRDSGGLWENYPVEEVATPEAFQRDPHKVWRFYSHRRNQAGKAKPNKAHVALVDFARKINPYVFLITQNVDYLHQRAGDGILSTHSMHGSLHQSRCTGCQRVYQDEIAYFDEKGKFNPMLSGIFEEPLEDSLRISTLKSSDELPLSPCCEKLLRPHIVWFGEVPFHLEEIFQRLENCELFVSIGTSGQVYPAAGFLQTAKSHGASTVLINQEPHHHNPFVDQFLEGKAGDVVPRFFRTI